MCPVQRPSTVLSTVLKQCCLNVACAHFIVCSLSTNLSILIINSKTINYKTIQYQNDWAYNTNLLPYSVFESLHFARKTLTSSISIMMKFGFCEETALCTTAHSRITCSIRVILVCYRSCCTKDQLSCRLAGLQNTTPCRHCWIM